MAGKPAVTISSNTAHGGIITGPGAPTVLIGGKPASVMGDMHTCPLVNPGTPPPPHVGGPVIATGVMVLICGKPATRMGDQAVCAGPPDSCIMGDPMVLIGDGGGGGGGGGQAGSAKRAQGSTAAVEAVESHFLDVTFEDKGGKPITGVQYTITGPDGRPKTGTLTGAIKASVPENGDYEIELKAISGAKWSKDTAKVGDKVKLSAKASGIESGTKAVFEIIVSDINFPDQPLATVESKVDGDKIEAEWEMTVDDSLLSIQEDKEERRGYSSPTFYFKVTSGGVGSRSGRLKYSDVLELKLVDQDGKAIGNVGYKVFLPNGKIISGKLDGNGKAKIDDVPPGQVRVAYDHKED